MNRRKALRNISIGMGLSISTGTLMTMVSSCKIDTDGDAGSSTDSTTVEAWTPKFFKTKEQAALVENLAEIIFPATSTPGAKDAGVIKYIDMIVAEVYTPKRKKRFQKGLDQYITSVEADQGGTIATLKSEQFNDFLQKHIGATANKEIYTAAVNMASLEDAPTDTNQQHDYYLYGFLNAVKNLTVAGYFGSELIATKHMNYLPVPGPFEGCIDYSGNDYSL